MKTRNDLLNEVKTKLQNAYRLDQKQQELINDCVDELLKAINYTHCCTELKGKEALTFEEFKKDNFIKKDGVYRQKTETKNRWFGEDYVRYAYSL